MSFNDTAIIGVGICVIGWIISIVYCFVRRILKPKKDKQLESLDKYIESIAICNGLKMPDESLTVDRKAIFKEITKRLMKDIQEVEYMIGSNSLKYFHNIRYKDFIFRPYGCAQFNELDIYGEISKWEGLYHYIGWRLSPEETINLAKQWPEAKLEILRLYRERKQQEILKYNKSVDELATLV